MAQGKELVWDETGKKLYETGVSKGVLYTQDDNGAYPKGVAWNGLSGVTESPSGAEATAVYADNIKYLNLRSAEEFKATVEAYMYPDEFAECDGSKTVAKGVTIGQQPRKSFGLCYKTIIGNDVKQDKFGYKLHFVYGATAAPSEKGYKTVSDSPEAMTFSWSIDTVPVNVTGSEPTATLVVDSRTCDPEKLIELENIIYGSTEADARLPLPDEIISIIGVAA